MLACTKRPYPYRRRRCTRLAADPRRVPTPSRGRHPSVFGLPGISSHVAHRGSAQSLDARGVHRTPRSRVTCPESMADREIVDGIANRPVRP